MKHRRSTSKPTSAARALGCAALALALAIVSGATPAAATAIEGVDFADRIDPGDDLAAPLELQGVALLRYKRIFKAYVAGLYMPGGVPADRVLDDVPKRLEIHYFWGIDGEDFGPAADAVLERTLSREEIARLRPRLDSLNRAYRAVEPGDRYALSYVPGRGTEVSLNGEPIALVPGSDFAAAYFAIWLGREPIDSTFRDRLLGSS